MEPFPIFIGYDEREDLAYKICEYTLRKYSSIPISIFPLNHRELRASEDFDREWIIDGPTGRYKDIRDGRFFSTQFSHSRFLVPHLCRKRGIKAPYAMFVDCDFVFQKDIFELIKEVNQSQPLSVVKHDFQVNKNTVKMDNQKQWVYSYKLWSSLMIFNLHSPANWRLTKEEVNYKPGSWLHSFQWLSNPLTYIGRDPDTQIHGLSEQWNYIPGHSSGTIGAVHFTEGMPFMKGYETCPLSEIWYKELKEYENSLRS